MPISNAQLALRLSELIDYWSKFAEEYANWLGGDPNGGPNSDGRYELTDYTGIAYLVKCPARLEQEVTGMVDSASSFADAASASATAAAASASTSTTQAGLAETARVAAEAAKAAAEVAQDAAENAAVNALAQAQNASNSAASATASAADAATSETNAADSAAAAAASAAAAAQSAAEAATFDPDFFYQKAEVDSLLADKLSLTGGTISGKVTLSATAMLIGTSTTDANDTPSDAGAWLFRRATSTALNLPPHTNNANGVLTLVSHGPSPDGPFGKQIGFADNNELYIRRFSNGIFQPWLKVWTEGNFDPTSKSDVGHTHDDRYYTESEVNALLAGKSDVGHNHDSLYAALSHNHDSRYYTEAEVDSLLAGKADTSHTHNYLPLAGGTLTGPLRINSSASGDTLLTLNTDRPWAFKQHLDDASTALALVNMSGGKRLFFGVDPISTAGNDLFEFSVVPGSSRMRFNGPLSGNLAALTIHNDATGTGAGGSGSLNTAGALIQKIVFTMASEGSNPAAQIKVINYNTSGTGWFSTTSRFRAGLTFSTLFANEERDALVINHAGSVAMPYAVSATAPVSPQEGTIWFDIS